MFAKELEDLVITLVPHFPQAETATIATIWKLVQSLFVMGMKIQIIVLYAFVEVSAIFYAVI